DRPKLDRLGRTSLRAGRLEASLHPIVTERALLRGARNRVDFNDAERAGCNAVAAAVAGVRLNDDGIELGPDNRARGADFEASRVHAVFADIAHKQPAAVFPVIGELLDKFHVTPVDTVEPARVIVAIAAERVLATVSGGEVGSIPCMPPRRLCSRCRRLYRYKIPWAQPYAPPSLTPPE